MSKPKYLTKPKGMTMSISEVTLTSREIMFLASTISGKEAKRAADKPSAISAFTKALENRIGESNAMDCRWEILLSEHVNSAHALAGQIISKFDGDEPEEILASFIGTPNAGDFQETVPVAAETTTREEENDMSTNENAGRRGRKATAAGRKLSAVGTENPRRAGSHGHRSHQIILDNPGITTEDFLAQGGRINDLNWDIAKGHVKAA